MQAELSEWIIPSQYRNCGLIGNLTPYLTDLIISGSTHLYISRLIYLPLPFSMLKRILRKAVVVLLLVYLIIFLIGWLYQDRMIFQRLPLDKNHRFTISEEYKEIWISGKDGTKLNGILINTRDSSKGLIVYTHGNRHHIQRYARPAAELTRYGYDVLMPDYRGYGKSEGYPVENDLYYDMESWLHYADSVLKPKEYIFYGRSLGSAMATYAATKKQSKLLILETPFDEIKSAAPVIFSPMLFFIPLKSTFSNISRLPLIQCPILIIHGTEDELIPLDAVKKLAASGNTKTELVIIEGAGHMNIRRFDLYHETIRRYLH